MLKKTKRRAFWLGLLLVAMMASCEVEFSPNADWKEVPVVYCVVDQDDDTTWVRVEKCFLGEGNVYSYGAVSDSINYPQGSLSVRMLIYQQGRVYDSVDFQYTTVDRAEGLFAHEGQPAYYAVTRGRMLRADSCRLEVRRAADGSMLASASTILIHQTEEALILEPNERVKFGTGNTTTFKWNHLANARRYQPRIRMYYVEGGDTMWVDLQCGDKVVTGTAAMYTEQYSRMLFLSQLGNALQGDTATRMLVEMADLYLTACNEDLNAYLTSVRSSSVNIESGEPYTNIRGGIGVFGARRTHLYKQAPVNTSIKSGHSLNDNNAGLLWCMNQLGLGLWYI